MRNHCEKVADMYFLHLQGDDKKSEVHNFCTINEVLLIKMLNHIKQMLEECLLR